MVMIRKLVNHIRLWNTWRKNCANNWWHKLLVLLGLRRSPTLQVQKAFADAGESIREFADNVWRTSESMKEMARIFNEKAKEGLGIVSPSEHEKRSSEDGGSEG